MTRTALIVMFCIGLLCTTQSQAGVLIARSPGTSAPVYNLVLSKMSSSVDIHGQFAVTHIDEEFYNGNNLTLEGFYAFQLPEGAKVDGLWLWENGVRKEFIVMEKEEAKRIYDSLTNPYQPISDPAILESLGANRFQLRVFPIEPFSSRRIELQYFHTLPLSSEGVVQYRYPLNLTGYQSEAVQTTSFHISLHSFQRITNLKTSFDDMPLFNSISKIDDNTYDIQFDVENISYTKDYTLSYTAEGIYEEFPTLAWTDQDDTTGADPYFMTWHAFKDEQDTTSVRDIVFVLDGSGSMAGNRIAAVKTAMHGILSSLSEQDMFRIVTFSSTASTWPSTNTLLPGTTDNITSAIDFIDTQYRATGSTSYEAGLIAGFNATFRKEADKKMVFLTDGYPNVGATSYTGLLKIIQTRDTSFVSFFPILFYTSKIQMLYDLSLARGGTTTQVESGDDLQIIIERILSDLNIAGYRDVHISYTGGTTSQVYPKDFPAITNSIQFITTGRYTGNGAESIDVTYIDQNSIPQWITRQVDFSTTSVPVKEVGAYWAGKRIDELLAEIKLEGASQQLIDSVVALSIKHSILTPYTAFIVYELAEHEDDDDPTHTPVETIGTVAESFSLGQNYPNPFSLSVATETVIPFTIATGCDVRIVISDLLGRTIVVLQEGFMTPGTYTVRWDGMGTTGMQVAPGTYLIRMTAGNSTQTRMIPVLR